MLNEDKITIEEVHEPFLLKKGFIIRTPRGRVLSELGQNYVEELKTN
jgi:Holliday junction DNA helicase RuvB